jgi:hypothetical protein
MLFSASMLLSHSVLFLFAAARFRPSAKDGSVGLLQKKHSYRQHKQILKKPSALAAAAESVSYVFNIAVMTTNISITTIAICRRQRTQAALRT